MTQEKNTPAAEAFVCCSDCTSPVACTARSWCGVGSHKTTTTPPPALEGGSLSPRVATVADLQGRVALIERMGAAMFLASSGNAGGNAEEGDHWADLGERKQEYWRDLAIEALAVVEKATGGDTRGEANPSPPPQEGLVEALEWALDEIDMLANRLVQWAYPQAMPMIGREDQFESYRAARAALSHHRAGVKT